MTRLLLGIVSKVGILWCNLMHDEPMWPANGMYQCRRCFRYHPVPWHAQELRSRETVDKAETHRNFAVPEKACGY